MMVMIVLMILKEPKFEHQRDLIFYISTTNLMGMVVMMKIEVVMMKMTRWKTRMIVLMIQKRANV